MTRTLLAQAEQRFGRGVISNPEIRISGRRGARLVCDCGNIYEVFLINLFHVQRPTQSCGCLKKEVLEQGRQAGIKAILSHGMRGHPLYSTWSSMMQRCYNPNDKGFCNWGGRGITVCPRWHNARSFIQDIEALLGSKPADRSIDRKRNGLGYKPSNVRWADDNEQARNRRIVKLTEASAAEIRERYAVGGVSQTELAAEYKVVKQSISNVIRNKTWRVS